MLELELCKLRLEGRQEVIKMPKRIPISTAKEVADKHNLKQILLIGYDGDLVHVVTYGKTKADCEAAAKAQDFWTGKIKEFSFEKSA